MTISRKKLFASSRFLLFLFSFRLIQLFILNPGLKLLLKVNVIEISIPLPGKFGGFTIVVTFPENKTKHQKRNNKKL